MKNMLLYYTVFLFASLASATECPNGLVYKKDCHKWCADLAQDFGECYEQIGCHCDGAKFWTNDRKCVDMFACPVTDVICPPRQIYSFNHGCPKTCKNPEGKGSCTVESNRCECMPGFVRNKDDKCVSVAECILDEIELGCTKDLVPKCGHGKNPTCNDYLQKPYYIKIKDEPIKECKPMCLCPEEQYLYTKNDTCVSQYQCEDLLGNDACQEKDPNSYFSACQPSNCNGLFCTADCQFGCFCKNGFLKNKDGMCMNIIIE